MPLIAGAIALLSAAVGVVLFWGAEALSLVLLTVLVEGDEGAFPGDEGEDPGLSALDQMRNAEGLGLPARVGVRWIMWLVEWLEGRRPRAKRLLWGLALGSAILFVRLGSATDRVLGRQAPERGRRRLGRRLLYEMVVAHRAS